ILGGSVETHGPHSTGPEQRAGAADDPHAVAREARRDVVALGLREVEDPAVGGGEVDARVGQADPEVSAGGAVRDEPGRRDEGLARYAVGEHAGTTEAVAVDHRDGGPESRRDQRGLI